MFYRLYAPDLRLEELAEELATDRDRFQAVYVKPGDTPAIWCTNLTPGNAPPPEGTPSFFDQQGYLSDADQGGLGVRTAWKQPGGKRFRRQRH